MKHSDDALQAIFLKEVTELASGELWLPGELDGFALALQWPSDDHYHLRKCYRDNGRSKVLCCGTFEKCKQWLSEYLHFSDRGNTREKTNMRLAGISAGCGQYH